MSDFIQTYHTHANGAKSGWWGRAVHSAHPKGDDPLDLDEDTIWEVWVDKTNTLGKARNKLLRKAWKKHQEGHPTHWLIKFLRKIF